MDEHYGVIGDPVGHSLSPRIHRWFAEQAGQTIDYQAYQVPAGQLSAFLASAIGCRLTGANVTLPHKRDACGLVGLRSERAEQAGAVNTLMRLDDGSWLGDNTDGVGLLRDLQHNLRWPVRGRSLLVIGAGGAAQGILPALLAAHPARVTLCNRNPERAAALAQRFGAESAPMRELGDGFEGIIHATAAGHQGDAPALPDAALGGAAWCYDLSYGVAAAPFLRLARAAGCGRYSDGLGMLVEQAAESFELWRGHRPETAEVLRRLRFEAESGSSGPPG